MLLKLRLSAIAIALSGIAFAQSPVLSPSQANTKEQTEEGPNLKTFKHFYVGFGLVDAIKEDHADFAFGKSNEWVFGHRYKRKITNWYSVGTTLEFASTNFHINSDSSVSPVELDRELIRTNSLNLGLYNRINIGKRGNRIGNYIQFGVYGQWVMNAMYMTKQTDNVPGKAFMTTLRNPDDVNRLNYGLTAAIGFNRIALTLRYRLSDLLDESDAANLYQNIPPIVFGIQFGIHK